MATFVSDTFTDTAGTALSSHTGETGATWTKTSYSGSATLVISDANRVRFNGSSSTIWYYASGTSVNANYEVQATIRYLTDADMTIGPAGRMSTSADTMYFTDYDSYSTDTFHRLFKVVAGAYTQLGSNYSEALSAGNERVQTLVMNGDQISLKVDGTTRVGPITDTAVTSAGRAGIRSFAGGGSNTTGLHIDTFSAADVGASNQTVAVTGLSVPVTFGTVTVVNDKVVSVTGHAVPVAIGSPTASTTVTVGVSGHPVPVAIGTPTASATITRAVTGHQVPVAIGTPTADTTVTVSVSGHPVPVAFGTVAVIQDNQPQTVAVTGLAVPVSFGTVTVVNDQVVAVSGLEVPVQFGSVTVIGGEQQAATTPAPGGIGHGKGKKKQIVLRDGRVITPRSEREFRRVLADMLSEDVPEAVEKVEQPIKRNPRKKKARSIGLTETVTTISPEVMAAIDALLSSGMGLQYADAVLAAQRALGLQQAMADDEEALMAILSLAA